MCTKLGIEHRFSLVCYPEYNGQVEMGFEEDKNNKRMRELLDFTDELRDQALYRMQEQKRRMSRFYNRRVKSRQVSTGTYELEELSGKAIDHTWHGVYLKKYYA
ncbi:hypothetical protein LIER_37836 [Lithospermum erythrorhizon]|uniref:Integrase catalytic domain-containing protein n=1 Tax=Lithospermum erythrorhizon TaxID=34254 RepID=A0AAV3PVI1_LITER